MSIVCCSSLLAMTDEVFEVLDRRHDDAEGPGVSDAVGTSSSS